MARKSRIGKTRLGTTAASGKTAGPGGTKTLSRITKSKKKKGRRKSKAPMIIGFLVIVILAAAGIFLYDPVMYTWNLARLKSDEPETVQKGREGLDAIQEYAQIKLREGIGSMAGWTRKLRSYRAMGRWGRPWCLTEIKNEVDAIVRANEQNQEYRMHLYGALGDLTRSDLYREVAVPAVETILETIRTLEQRTADANDPYRMALRERVKLLDGLTGMIETHPDMAGDIYAFYLEHLADPSGVVRATSADLVQEYMIQLMQQIEDGDFRVREKVFKIIDRIAGMKTFVEICIELLEKEGSEHYWTRHVSFVILNELIPQSFDYDPMNPDPAAVAEIRAWIGDPQNWQTVLDKRTDERIEISGRAGENTPPGGGEESGPGDNTSDE